MPADYRNDAVHPMLSRARPLSQATLDGDGLGRSSYGGCAIEESTGAGGLTDFTFGGSQTGIAWSINPYAGCLHACSYCYVPDTLHAERRKWGSRVIVKKDLPTRLALAVARSGKLTCYFSTATDPYQSVEAEHQITRRCLEVLVRKDWPVEILTRSPLVLRDLDLLRQLSNVRVGLSVPTLDDGLRRVLEPAAPAIPARLRALRKLSDQGIPTFANYTPACPPTTHDAPAIAQTFLDAGAQWVNSTRWKRRATTIAPLWERLRGTEWEHLPAFFASKPRQHAWHDELGKAFRKLGLALGTSFYNPPFEFLQAQDAGPRQATLQEIQPIQVPAYVRGRRN